MSEATETRSSGRPCEETWRTPDAGLRAPELHSFSDFPSWKRKMQSILAMRKWWSSVEAGAKVNDTWPVQTGAALEKPNVSAMHYLSYSINEDILNQLNSGVVAQALGAPAL